MNQVPLFLPLSPCKQNNNVEIPRAFCFCSFNTVKGDPLNALCRSDMLQTVSRGGVHSQEVRNEFTTADSLSVLNAHRLPSRVPHQRVHFRTHGKCCRCDFSQRQRAVYRRCLARQNICRIVRRCGRAQTHGTFSFASTEAHDHVSARYGAGPMGREACTGGPPAACGATGRRCTRLLVAPGMR